MKKTNTAYVAGWYGGTIALLVLLVVGGYFLNPILSVVGVLLAIPAAIFLPVSMRGRMEKNALALEQEFPKRGFTYQYKFTSNSGVFYIDEGGRLGVVWRGNPTELQFADLNKMTDVRTSNGQQLRGTALVSCQFRLDGKKYKIYTLRVSNGQLAMNHPKVIDAIQKADGLCARLNNAKAAAQNAAR